MNIVHSTALINENNFDSSLCTEAARNLIINEGLILTIYLSMTGYLSLYHLISFFLFSTFLALSLKYFTGFWFRVPMF